ncbi:hypothetical protein ACJ73_01147 [Blastomyces percursus]|uniref:Uncharacterized protein n=1 Tax=Blastomyces percursus TaxID=1658174 RepID=A0A1J9QG34_9EURO|nr:hypothetical protein ACJ73_01147 [Blastomyces percursus]
MRPQFAPASTLLVLLRLKSSIRLTVRGICYRKFSSTRLSRFDSLADFREANVQIPIGSSGDISLNVLEPITQRASPRANLILYLPPGPLFPNDRSGTVTRFIDDTKKSTYADPFPSPQYTLASTSLSTVVTVNYRLGHVEENGEQKRYYYPGPVHDTLAGFDWVFENLKPNRLCVFGKHIGGSLAVMLALTEPRSVTAIAAHEPMCDWTSLDDYCLKTDPVTEEGIALDGIRSNGGSHGEKLAPIEEQTAKKHRRKKKIQSPPEDLVPLLEARSALFRNPDNYFDSFASPVLLLRSAGKDTPKIFPAYHTGPDYPIPVLKIPPKDIISGPNFARYFQDLDLDLITPPPLDLDSNFADPEKPIRRRKALSRWPPYGLEYNDRPGVKSVGLWGGKPNLPHVRIFVHSNFPFEPLSESPPELAPEGKVEADIFTTASQPGNGDRNPLTSRAGGASVQVEESREFDSDAGTEESTSKSISARPRRPRTPRKGTLEADGETILARQGAEMVSLMRNACFWGREKGYAEEKVKAVSIPLSSSSTVSVGPQEDELDRRGNDRKGAESCIDQLSSVEEQAGRYFYDTLKQENRKKW